MCRIAVHAERDDSIASLLFCLDVGRLRCRVGVDRVSIVLINILAFRKLMSRPIPNFDLFLGCVRVSGRVSVNLVKETENGEQAQQ